MNIAHTHTQLHYKLLYKAERHKLHACKLADKIRR